MANITDIVNSIVRYLGKVSITLNGRWKDNIEYDRLCVVYNDFASYISKQKVPAGTKLTNTTYWQILSNLQEEIKIDYETFKTEILEDIADLNKRQIVGRIVVSNDNELNALTIEQVNAGAEVYVLDTKKTYIIDSIDTQNNKEYHEQVYNSLSTIAYSSVPKEDRKVENIKVLKDYIVEFGDKLTTFPITLIQAILDLESGKNLSSLLSMFNYLVLPWNGNFAATVNEVPLVMRNLGTLVTYKDTDGFIWTKRYKLSDFSNANWSNIDNWEGWDLKAAEDEIIAVVEKIFTNIDDYPPVKEVIVTSVTTATNDVLNDIASHPDLYAKFKSTIETKVGDVFKNLDSYPDLKNLLNTYVVNQVNYIFANIDSYPVLKTTIENSVKSVFTNIDNYPALKKVITDKIVEIAPGLINTIFTNINNYPTLKSAIELGVYNRTDYVFKHLDDYPELKALIEANSGGSKLNMLTAKFTLTSDNNCQIINIDEVRSGITDIELMGYKHCLIEIVMNDISVWKCIGTVIKYDENNYNFSYIAPLNGFAHRIVYRGNIVTNSFTMYYEEKSNSTIHIRAEWSNNLADGKVKFTIQNEAGRQIWDFVDAYPLPTKIYIFNCVITYKTEDNIWGTAVGTMQFTSDNNGTKKAVITTVFFDSGDIILAKHNWLWENIDTANLILNSVAGYAASDFLHIEHLGAASGVCPLDGSAKVNPKYLPSYVDDVIEFDINTNFANTSEIVNHPAYTNRVILANANTPAPYTNTVIKTNNNTSTSDWTYEAILADKIYVNKISNKVYRWTGSNFAEIGPASVVIGEITGTAYDGAKGKKVTDNVNTIPGHLLGFENLSETITDSYYSVLLDKYLRQANGNWELDDIDNIVYIPLANEQHAGLISPNEKKIVNGILTIVDVEFFDPLIGTNISIGSQQWADISSNNLFKKASAIFIKNRDTGETITATVESFTDNNIADYDEYNIVYNYINKLGQHYRYYATIKHYGGVTKANTQLIVHYKETVTKKGFELGEAFNWIVSQIGNNGGVWPINEDDFNNELDGSGIQTDLHECVYPIQFMINCCENQLPLVCKQTYVISNGHYYSESVPVKCMFTNNGVNSINRYNFKADFENQSYQFNIRKDPDGILIFEEGIIDQTNEVTGISIDNGLIEIGYNTTAYITVTLSPTSVYASKCNINIQKPESIPINFDVQNYDNNSVTYIVSTNYKATNSVNLKIYCNGHYAELTVDINV